MNDQQTRGKASRRLVVAAGILATVLVVGAEGFHTLGAGRWSWLDCFYMTVITLSTVGFGETLPGMNEEPLARLWTIGLIIIGSGTLVYFVSNLTALIVEGELQGALKRRRMNNRIEKLEDHIIVCGVGSTGVHVVGELQAIGVPYVVVDVDEERVQHVQDEQRVQFPYVIGDAVEDQVLERAGVTRAKGVVAVLHEDRDNVFVTITARALNPQARIVAKAVERTTEPKLRRAGADSVVSPNFIGGMRMVSEMVRPSVVEFLDRMLRVREESLRIEELKVPAGCELVGKTLGRSGIREEFGALVMAMRAADGEYVYNPRGDTRIEPGITLIFIARAQDVVRLRERFGAVAA